MKHFTYQALGAFLLFFSMVLWHQDARAQLAAGDLAITGYNFDNPDEFVILVLNDIPAGQVIYFTDNGWFSSGSFRTGEGTVTWTNNTGSVIVCGSTIVFDGTSVNVGIRSNSGNFFLSGSGDQILVYTGSLASPTFITALHSNGSTWESNATSSNTSAIPSGLINGTTAVSIPEVDNGYFDCSTISGSPADIRTAVSNSSNWTTSNSNISNINPCTWNVTCPVPCTADAGTLTAPASACAPATFSASASSFENGGDYTQTYILADASGNILDVQSSGLFSSIAGGSYTVAAFNYLTADGAPTTSDNLDTYSNGTDCFDIASQAFNVGDPQPALDSPPSQVCVNGIATFSLSASYFSYNWSAPSVSITDGGGSSDGFAEVTFGNTAATVSVTVTDQYGCTASTSQAVTIGVTDDLAQQGCGNCGRILLRICEGDATPDLNAYIMGGNSAYVNGYAIQFYANNNGAPGTHLYFPPTINTANPGTYKYWVSQQSPDGCESVNKTEVRVRVRATPDVSMSMPNALCEGAQVDLAAYVSDAANKTDLYTFYMGDPNNGGTLLGSATATNGTVNAGQFVVQLFTPGTKTIYVVASNNFNNPPNCSAVATQTVVINPRPVVGPIANIGPVCPGDPVQVNFSSAPTGSFFVWTNSNTNIGLGANGLGDLTFAAAANTSAQAEVGQISVSAILNNCLSNPVSFSVTVGSDPVLASGLTDIVCSRSGASIDLAGNSVTNMAGEKFKYGAPTLSAPMTGTGSEVVIGSESFDGGGVGYAAPGQFYDGSNDLFSILNGSVGPTYIGKDGTNYWATEDTDDNGGDGQKEKTLTLNPINISAAVNPRFEILFATGRVFEYDAADYLYVEYNVDNTGWNQGLRFSYVFNGDAFNEPLALDTDNDGIGDGQQLTNTFAGFGFNIPNGNSVQVRVRLSMDGGDEEVAFDNLQVFGTVPGGGARTTASAAPISDGYQNTTGSPQTVTYMVVPVSALGCEGDPVAVVVTIKPEPVVASASASVCSGEGVNIALSEASSMPGVSYNWSAPTLPNGVFVLGPLTAGNGNTISGYSFVNTTGSSQDVIFEVSAISGAGCQGEPTQIVVTVAPATQGALSYSTSCEDAPGTGLATFNLSPGPVYIQDGPSWLAIANPAAYTSSTASVFTLVAGSNPCNSIWAQIDLMVNDAPLSPAVDNIDVCEGESTKITPGAPGPQAFEAFWEFDNASTAGVSNQGAAIPQNASFGSGIGGVSFFSDAQGGTAYAGTNWNSSSLDPNDYLEFCVSPSGSFDLELTGISFRERRSGSGPMEVEVHYSTDGFATSGTLIPGTDISITGTAFTPISFNFASSIIHNGPICLRIYGYDGGSSQGTWRFDDVAVKGNLIPQLGSEAADFMWTFEGDVNTGASSSANGSAANAAFGSGNGSVTYSSGNGGGDSYSANSWSTGALNTNDYIEFCVSANAGWEMELTDLEFDERRSGSGVRDLEVYYSLDNFATAGTFVGSEGVADNTGWSGQEFGFTISGATQVCFRVYGYNAEQSGGTWRFDNVVISGALTQMATPAASAFNFYDANPSGGSANLLAGGVVCYDPQTAPGSSQTVWVTAQENGCESPAVAVNVNVKSAPFIQATSNSPVCEGSDINLSAAGQAIQYNWSGPNFTFQGANATIIAATPANSGSYQLVGIDGDGCTDTVYTQVHVEASPNAGNGAHVTFSVNDPIVNLFSYLINNPQTGGVWAGPNATPLPTGYLGQFNPATQLPGYYTYTTTGVGACTGAAYDSSRILVTITIPTTPPSIAASVMLQGSYDAASGLMSDGLRSLGVLPLNEPFTGLGYAHIGGGAEYTSQPVMNVTGMDAIVDWVVIELRDAQDQTLVIATRSALLQRDGDIVDVDGTSAVTFNMATPGNYHVAIFHRNHLKVMTAGTYGIGATATIIDMTSTNTAIQGIQPMLEINNVRLMFAGDADGNGQIQNTDDVDIWKNHVGTSGYNGGDYNLDGQIQNSDRMLLWVPNAGKGTQVPD